MHSTLMAILRHKLR